MYNTLKVVNNTGGKIRVWLNKPEALNSTSLANAEIPAALGSSRSFTQQEIATYLQCSAAPTVFVGYSPAGLSHAVIISSVTPFNFSATNAEVIYTCASPAPGNITRQPAP
jgi:hypothetical protein